MYDRIFGITLSTPFAACQNKILTTDLYEAKERDKKFHPVNETTGLPVGLHYKHINGPWAI